MDSAPLKRGRGFSFDFHRDRAFSWDATGEAAAAAAGTGTGIDMADHGTTKDRYEDATPLSTATTVKLTSAADKDIFTSPSSAAEPSSSKNNSSTVSPMTPVALRSRRNSLSIDDGDLDALLKFDDGAMLAANIKMDEGGVHDPNDMDSQQAYFASIFKSEHLEYSSGRQRNDSLSDYIMSTMGSDGLEVDLLSGGSGGTGNGKGGKSKNKGAPSSSSNALNAHRGYVAGSSKDQLLTSDQQATYGAAAVQFNAEGQVCIGIYTRDERRQLIEKFRAKKQRRIWRKQIKYDCRKRLAETRPRVKGRFVSKKELAEGNWRLQPDGEWRDESQMTAEELTVRDAALAAAGNTLLDGGFGKDGGRIAGAVGGMGGMGPGGGPSAGGGAFGMGMGGGAPGGAGGSGALSIGGGGTGVM